MKENKNIRLQPMLLAMVVLAIVLAGVLIYAGLETRASYNQMQEAVDTYVTCEASAQKLMAGSDELTKQVQLYAVNGKAYNMDQYFKEAKVTRSRDKALEEIGEYFDGTQAYAALEEALARSNELMDIEYYSMRLMAEYRGISPSILPEEVRAVELTPEDQALSPDGKKELARELVFGSAYEGKKTSITNSAEQCMNELRSMTRAGEQKNARQLIRYLNLSYALVAALMLLVFLTFLMTTLLALNPLRRAIGSIRDKELIPERGSYEVQYLARTYNTMFEKNQVHQDKLSYEATHDALTRLYNRGVFEEVLPTCEAQHNALILVDLDYFKQMNDNHGHQVGDQVLQKLSKALQASFRGEDYVCRIGGDEFAVLMVNVGPDMKGLVSAKVDQIRKKTREDDGLPPFTLSVGIAFSEIGQPGETVFAHADAALYKVKEQGRNNYAFYEEGQSLSDLNDKN